MPTRSLLVLVVDDDPDMRLYISGCLRSVVPVDRVLEASNGVEAMALLRSGAVDLLITDLLMPRLDGYELCRALREDPDLLRIPVLVVSGAPRERHASADAFLAKPFNARQLRQAVERLIDAPA